MNIICEQLNPHSCKTYLIAVDGRKEVALIDPVIEHLDDYIQMIKSKELSLSTVLETHTHADHISGGASLKDIFECEYAMHEKSPVKCATMNLVDDYEWKLFGLIPVRVLYTPGHTRDSVSFVFPEWIFTGDALFLDEGGAGRDDLPGGDPGAHWETLKKFQDLPEDLIVYPAHDYRGREPSSLKRQKTTNPHLKMSTESRDRFVQYLEDLKLGPAEWMKDVLNANYACARDPQAAWIPVDAPACEVKGTMDVGANDIEVASILPAKLKEMMESNAPPVLLDVREENELAGPLGHIGGIVHIPIAALSRRLSELEQFREREIVTVCRSGGRAYTAAQILRISGFRNVTVLEGGMLGWNAL